MFGECELDIFVSVS